MNPSLTVIETVTQLISRLSETKGSTFIGLTYTSTSGRLVPETARYLINTNVNLERVYKADLEKLRNHRKTLSDPLELKACDELIASLEKSLEKGIGNNPDFTRKNHVERIDGTLRKVTSKDGEEYLEIMGIVRSKKVEAEGVYKPVKSQPKTIAKNAMKKLLDLGTSKIRSLSIKIDKIEGVRMNGEIIELI